MPQPSRAPRQRFTPAPPPGAGARSHDRPLPPLPVHMPGAPRTLPPGARRPAPGVGGLHGLGTPPEVRRRTPGGVKAAPGAAAATEAIRGALGKARGKLLDSQRKLRIAVLALRAQMASR